MAFLAPTLSLPISTLNRGSSKRPRSSTSTYEKRVRAPYACPNALPRPSIAYPDLVSKPAGTCEPSPGQSWHVTCAALCSLPRMPSWDGRPALLRCSCPLRPAHATCCACHTASLGLPPVPLALLHQYWRAKCEADGVPFISGASTGGARAPTTENPRRRRAPNADSYSDGR